MQLNHAPIVAAEKSGKVLRQILFIKSGKRTHNAKINQHEAAKGGWLNAHHDVAWVHVCVEIAIAKDFGKKQVNTIARQLFDIYPKAA